MKPFKLFVLLFVLAAMAFTLNKHKPVFYIIGDSTVRNGNGNNTNLLQGWGSFIAGYFDTTKISIQNDAIGGRSSRTFMTDGRWDKILITLQKGDYVIMQFGHNDGGPLDDTARARGTIKGIGDDSVEIYNPIRKQKEFVHTYGWYIRKYVMIQKLHKPYLLYVHQFRVTNGKMEKWFAVMTVMRYGQDKLPNKQMHILLT
jgi:rhamnogalacturonan acetylesterase